MHLNKVKKILYTVLWLLPFILGTVGYCMEGERVVDSLYDAFALYAVNPVSDANNWIIIIAKWGAPLVLASGILMVLRGALKRLRDYYISLHKGAAAVYSDNEYGNMLAASLNKGILVTDRQLREVWDHILLFADDMENLDFYQRNKEALKGKNVYMQLSKIDSFLLRENSIHFFNVNEIIARNYWREHHLLPYFESGARMVKIAVFCFSSLGQQLLNYALLNNIYDLDQQIEYHIWGNSLRYEHMLENGKMMNNDRCIYHGNCWAKDIQQFPSMDRIIITEEDQTELIQTLLYLCSKAEIHCYDSRKTVLQEIYKYENLLSFGSYADILTEQNIKGDKLYRAAKELNYKYACIYGNVSGDESKKEQEMEEQWEHLDGFTKGSNIASADYHEIRKLIIGMAKSQNKEITMDFLGRMEHIRWCRFHYLNHWNYGVPENGKNKDASRRIHVCLVPFDELTKEDQEKDYEAVKVLMELG